LRADGWTGIGEEIAKLGIELKLELRKKVEDSKGLFIFEFRKAGYRNNYRYYVIVFLGECSM
jgi:hypothetical protein